MTAAEISKKLGLEKRKVNSCLYGTLGDRVIHSGQPPRWSMQEDWDASESEEKSGGNQFAPEMHAGSFKLSSTWPLVVIDLGNVHDCLQELVCMKNCPEIHAFAPRIYNGPGINPRIRHPNVSIHETDTMHRNACIHEITFWISRYVLGSMRRKIVLASGGFSMSSLADILKREGHDVHVVRNWKEMKALNFEDPEMKTFGAVSSTSNAGRSPNALKIA